MGVARGYRHKPGSPGFVGLRARRKSNCKGKAEDEESTVTNLSLTKLPCRRSGHRGHEGRENRVNWVGSTLSRARTNGGKVPAGTARDDVAEHSEEAALTTYSHGSTKKATEA